MTTYYDESNELTPEQAAEVVAVKRARDERVDNPAPIDDAPPVCATCSALGAVAHECEDTESCPCGSPMCGASDAGD